MARKKIPVWIGSVVNESRGRELICTTNITDWKTTIIPVCFIGT